MTDPDRVPGILADWYERGDHTPEELIAEHPDAAAELREHFAALRLLRRSGTPPAPREIGDFRIVREIGRGGMGVVYEAEQVSMKRRVALKVLSLSFGSAPHATRRFEREAQAAGRLHHTNIVPVYAMGEHRGQWYYAMELVEGRPLSDVVAELRAQGGRPTEETLAGQGPRTPPTSGTGTGDRSYFVRVAGMFAGVADALHLAHTEGIVHRDVKPSNLLLDADGALKIVDFGLARVADDGPSVTITGDLLGTPAYMSPEQAMAKRIKLDHRTDVYSLGATLYELLTLRPPFEGSTLHEICSQIITKDPAAPRRRNRRIPRDLETIVVKAMEKDRDGRYQTAGDFARDLRRFAEGAAVRARRVGLAGQAWRKARRHKVRTALGIGVATLILLLGLSVAQSRREGRLRVTLEYEDLLFRATNAAECDSGDAAALLRRAIALDPDRPEAYWIRTLLVREADLDEVLADADRAHARGLGERPWRLLRAHFLRSLGRAEDGRLEMILAGDGGSTNADELYLEAACRQHEGDAAAAGRILDALLEAPGGSRLIRVLARRRRMFIEADRNEWTRVVRDGSELGGQGSVGGEVELHLAVAWRRLGQEEAAQRAFDAALGKAHGPALVRLALLCGRWGETAWLGRLAAARSPDSDPYVLAAGSEAASRAGRSDEALALIDRAIARVPDDHRLHELRGACLAKDQPREALKAYADALRLAPSCPNALRFQSAIYDRLGEFGLALEAATAASRLRPWDGALQDNRRRVLARLGRLDEALEAADQACRLDPQSFDFAQGRAWVLRALGRFDEALKAYDLTVSLRPTSAAMQLSRGALLHDAFNRFPEALEAFDRAIELDPDLATAHRNRGKALSSLGRHREALESCERAIALDPRLASALLERAVELLILGRPAEALRSCDQALGIEKANATAHALRGKALLDLRRADEALAGVDRAIELDPNLVQAHITRGVLLCDHLDRRTDALAAFDRAITIDSGSADAHIFRGATLWNLGRASEALQAWDRAVELGGGSPGLWNRVAWFRATTTDETARDPARAVALARKAVTASPDQGDYWNTLGVALYRAGEWKESLDALAKSMELGKGGTACDWFFAAMAHARLGEREKARELYERAVAWTAEHAPQNEELRRFREEAAELLRAK